MAGDPPSHMGLHAVTLCVLSAPLSMLDSEHTSSHLYKKGLWGNDMTEVTQIVMGTAWKC